MVAPRVSGYPTACQGHEDSGNEIGGTFNLPKSTNTHARLISMWSKNLIPVSFGQRQDTGLWNNPFQESKILGLPEFCNESKVSFVGR